MCGLCCLPRSRGFHLGLPGLCYILVRGIGDLVHGSHSRLGRSLGLTSGIDGGPSVGGGLRDLRLCLRDHVSSGLDGLAILHGSVERPLRLAPGGERLVDSLR
jgi:hypothetical protein